MPPTSPQRKAEAVDRFRHGEDNREDRDVLRAWRIEFVRTKAGPRAVPAEEEPEPAPVVKKGRAPKVWRM